MRYIVTIKRTQQVSEDQFERVTLTRAFPEYSTLRDVENWVDSKGGDINTIQMHINEAD